MKIFLKNTTIQIIRDDGEVIFINPDDAKLYHLRDNFWIDDGITPTEKTAVVWQLLRTEADASFATKAEALNYLTSIVNFNLGGRGVNGIGDFVVFFEEFTGNGINTQFQLTDNIQNATFSNGIWQVGYILNTKQSDVVNSALSPIYDSIIPIVRNKISVSSISSGGLVTLSHAPRDTAVFRVYYSYRLSTEDRLTDYYKDDIVNTAEADNNTFTDFEKDRNDLIQFTAAGMVASPSLTDLLTGEVTLGAGTARLFENATKSGLIREFSVTGGTTGVDFPSLTDNDTNYIVIRWNLGNPIYDVILDVSEINESDVIPVYTIYKVGTGIAVLDWDAVGTGGVNKAHARFVKTRRFELDTSIGGLGIGEVAVRTVTVGAGRIWYGFNPQDLAGFNSSADILNLWYHLGGVWTQALITQYNNTQYDDGTDLQSVGVNRFAVNWIYREVSGTKRVAILLGGGNYTLAQAEASGEPARPEPLQTHYVLVGRIIVQVGATTATLIQSAFEQVLGHSPISNHNDTANKQGGTTNEYYHLSLAAYTEALKTINHLQARNTGTIAAASFTTPLVVDFDATDVETNPAKIEHNNATISRVDIKNSGIAELSFSIAVYSTGGSTYNVTAYLRVNGTTQIAGTYQISGNYGGEDTIISVPSKFYNFTANDYVELVIQNSNLTGSVDNISLTVKNKA